MNFTKKKTDSKKPVFVLLVCQNANAIVGNLGNQVKDPENEIDWRDESKNTNNKGNDILCFKIAQDSVNTADDCAKEDLQKDLCDLRQSLIGTGNSLFCLYVFWGMSLAIL